MSYSKGVKLAKKIHECYTDFGVFEGANGFVDNYHDEMLYLLDTVDSIRHERFELEITEDEEVEELTKVLNRIRKYAKIHRLLAELSKPNQ
jgi:hypothetical protein